MASELEGGGGGEGELDRNRSHLRELPRLDDDDKLSRARLVSVALVADDYFLMLMID